MKYKSEPVLLKLPNGKENGKGYYTSEKKTKKKKSMYFNFLYFLIL